MAIVYAFLSADSCAWAQPHVGTAESIESIAINADFVFIGTLRTLSAPNDPDARGGRTVNFEVNEILRQNLFIAVNRKKFRIQSLYTPSVLGGWLVGSSRLMVAFDGYKPSETTIIDLTPSETEVLRSDFTLIRKPEAVIDAVQETLRQVPLGIRRMHTFSLLVPAEAVAGTRWGFYYQTGGYLQLSVPVNDSLQDRAVKYLASASSWNRREAAEVLRYFPSDENANRLRNLLDDSGWSYLYHPEENNGVEVRLYDVRRAAYQSLRAWGVKVDKPVIREKRHTKD